MEANKENIPPEDDQAKREIPMYKFDEEQIVCFKYNKGIHMFVVGQEFDPQALKRFYYCRIFEEGKVNSAYIKVAESEIESILTEDQESYLRETFPNLEKVYVDGDEVEFKENENEISYKKDGTWTHVTFEYAKKEAKDEQKSVQVD